ncbi:hypothetical protein TSAR_008537, partial [Trichomalopsis sarcophagae]
MTGRISFDIICSKTCNFRNVFKTVLRSYTVVIMKELFFFNWKIVKSKQQNISRLMFLDSHAVAINPFIKRMPKDVQKKYKEDLLREVSNFEYAFLTQGNELSEQPKLLGRYSVIIAYINSQQPLNNI